MHDFFCPSCSITMPACDGNNTSGTFKQRCHFARNDIHVHVEENPLQMNNALYTLNSGIYEQQAKNAPVHHVAVRKNQLISSWSVIVFCASCHFRGIYSFFFLTDIKSMRQVQTLTVWSVGSLFSSFLHRSNFSCFPSR